VISPRRKKKKKIAAKPMVRTPERIGKIRISLSSFITRKLCLVSSQPLRMRPMILER